jgi:hypothetical protein
MQLPLLKSGSFFVPQVLNGHPQARRPLEVELAAIDGFLQHRKLKAESSLGLRLGAETDAPGVRPSITHFS